MLEARQVALFFSLMYNQGMKKLSLLLGTLGGATAGYLFSNKKLRDQLTNAKDAEEAARILGKHLQKDGKKLGKQIQEFVESEDVQQNFTKAKKYAKETLDEAQAQLGGAVDEKTTKAKKAVKKATKTAGTKAKKAVKKTKTKAKKTVKKTSKKAKKSANSAARRMKTKVRKLS
mgnify:FL=1